ncbi:MAG: protein kinase, partial [Anaerolineales bacterium]
MIIDAGTGIRNLGLELMKGPCGKGQGRLHILFSHPHWDHIQGFPFFLPAFIPGNQIAFYSIHNLEMALTEQQRYLFFPVAIDAAQAEKELALIGTEIRSRYGFIPSMQAQRDYIRLEPGKPFTIGPVTISTLRNHHPGDAYSYRIDDQHSAFVYASDAEYKDLDSSTFQERVNFFKNADAILFDAQYGLRDSWENKVNYGHSSAMIGVDFARRAGAKRLLLGHHEPTYSDDLLQEIQETAVAYQSQDPSLPLCEVVVAYEGLELDLAPPGAVEMQLTSNEEAAVLTPGTQFDEQGVKQLMSLVANARHAEEALDTIVNLSQVERLTTAGLKMLVLSSREIEPGLMVLVAPSASVREVIKLGGYDDHFAIYPTVSDAVKAVQAREALNLPGHLIKDQYQILETLGQSAVGTLLKVFDQRNHRQAALRVLSPAFKVQTVEAFIKQVRRLPDLDHRFLARVFDYDWDADDDLCFVVEEFVTGQRLSDHLAGIDGALEANEAMDLALDLMHVLEYTHSRGIIHGNLRPQDIFLTDEGIKVSGFSLARLEEGRRFLETTAHFLEASHLAPEQILGQPLDARTDLYALGVILYRLFTGRALFEESGQALFRAHLDRAPRRPRDLNPAISRSVEHFMLKLVAKNPNERYASAQQARQVFNSLLLGAAEAGKPARQRLVGRETQLQTLLDRWQEAETGRGQLVFITGEPGVGKTTLTRHLARQIESPIVLVGSCLEEESSPAYQPFRQALQTYFATVPP